MASRLSWSPSQPARASSAARALLLSRDTRFLQRYLDSIHDRTDGEEDYVGEWHVHATDNPVLLIVEHDSPVLRLRFYGFVARPRRQVSELAVIRSLKPSATSQPD